MRYTEKFDTVRLQTYTDAQVEFIASVEADYDSLGDIQADFGSELDALAGDQ